MNKRMVTTQLMWQIGIVLLVVGIVMISVVYYVVRTELQDHLNKDLLVIRNFIQEYMATSQQYAETVEHLIDLQLLLAGQNLSSRLAGREAGDITREELEAYAAELGLQDISLFARTEDDIVVFQSTNPLEIGLSAKPWGYWYTAFDDLLDGREVSVSQGFKAPHFWSGPISLSAVENHYYKYGYYQDGSTSFLINPYLSAEQLYPGMTGELNRAVEELIRNYPPVLEVAVINIPAYLSGRNGKVIEPDRDAAVFIGSHTFGLDEDVEILSAIHNGTAAGESHISFSRGDRQYDKVYMPIDSSRALVLVADNEIRHMIERHFLLPLLAGFAITFAAMIAIIYLIAGRKLRPLKEIESYLGQVAAGDFDMRIQVRDNNELGFVAAQIGRLGDRMRELVEAANRRANDTIAHLELHDALTDLPNRVQFSERINAVIEECRQSGEAFAVMMLDFDQFKKVNDSLGHTAGDYLLQVLASRLQSSMEPGMLLSRMSGDEFVILIAGLRSKEETAHTAKRLHNMMEEPVYYDEHEFCVTASSGIVFFPADGADVNTLLKNAETAMYYAKDQGRNQHQFYDGSMNESVMEQVMLEQSLRSALDNDEFSLEYQPQVELKSGRVKGIEALLRWNHPKLGRISPAKFIPLAEKSGLIVPIGEWVLRKACLHNKTLQKVGYPPIRVSVNLSVRQFQQEDIAERVAGILKETGLEPQYLELEITESMAMYTPDRDVDKLKALKKLGVSIAIDDFGTGYSSLHYLNKYPIDALKIDRSFVGDIPGDADDAAIVSAIVRMAHSLKLKVIAEGVESKEQAAFLRELQCEEMQGYLISKPVCFEELVPLLYRLYEDAS